jgi:DNA mismatch repair ATPase MutS
VCNDVSLGLESRFYLITGSNMAGKSTFLRSIGLNAVMAFAGGPVRASSARMTSLTVCASLALTDSLMEGRSKFFAEVNRLGKMVCCARMGKPVLFLVDEILSGTNSKDRKAVAEDVIKSLLNEGAIGALSTHDSALAEIGAAPALQGSLIHMESENADDPLDFDYRVKPGISTRSSALAIVKMIGV